MDTLPTAQSADLRTSDLQPGDVLLHMGSGELSKLIAWVGDSAYSHAAMVVDDNNLIEAAASGVRHAGLAERARMRANFHYIDAFRPLRPTAQDAQGRGALLAAVDVYLGRPYPMTSLLTLGVICAVRNKMPGGAQMQQVLRMALDLVVRNDASQVVCSELVYRAFDEALTTPAHALRLPLTTQWVAPTPMPKIDIGLLLAECIDDYRRSRPNASVAAQSPTESPDSAQLAELLAQARTSLDLDGPLKSGAGDYAPNPKTVLPADLQFSPSLRKIGRLAMKP